MPTKSKRVSVSKQKLAKQADAVEGAAVGMAVEGAVDMEAGAETLEVGRVAVRLALGRWQPAASDLTRAETLLVASRMAAEAATSSRTAGVVDMSRR
jgi:hypothetical protein